MLHIIGFLLILYLLIGLIGRRAAFTLVGVIAGVGAIVVAIGVGYALMH